MSTWVVHARRDNQWAHARRDNHTHALGGHALIRPDQKQLPVGQGQSAEPGHLGRGRSSDRGAGWVGKVGSGWAATCLAWRLCGARAHVHQQQRGQWELGLQRQAAAGGEGARRCGHRVLGTGAGTQSPRTAGAALPRPSPHPAPPADLGLTHASELLWRGEYRPAEALPLAVGATEPVVQVQRDVHQPCGVGHWGRASPGRLPPGPPRPRPGVPTHLDPGAPRAGAGSR